MAIFFRSSNLWIFSLKLLLISASALSIAVILNLSVPVIAEFLLTAVPVLWTSLRSWLTPPYLYVVINGIILMIAASSRFHQKADELERDSVVSMKTPAGVRQDFAVSAEYYDDVALKQSAAEVRSVVGDLSDQDDVVLVKKNPMKQKPELEVSAANAVDQSTEGKVSMEETVVPASTEEEKEDLVMSSSKLMLNRMDSTEILSEFSLSPEKPLVSARFGHRRNVTVSPEAGKSLRVAKPKRQDTLENTWKKITEGRSMPLTRHLKKSDTWETHGHDQNSAPQDSHGTLNVMKKAETFNEASTTSSSTSSPSKPLRRSKVSGKKLKKDPSLSQEELNRRVEAFIKKFNEEMRLQRQESLNQYMETINRGDH